MAPDKVVAVVSLPAIRKPTALLSISSLVNLVVSFSWFFIIWVKKSALSPSFSCSTFNSRLLTRSWARWENSIRERMGFGLFWKMLHKASMCLKMKCLFLAA